MIDRDSFSNFGFKNWIDLSCIISTWLQQWCRVDLKFQMLCTVKYSGCVGRITTCTSNLNHNWSQDQSDTNDRSWTFSLCSWWTDAHLRFVNLLVKFLQTIYMFNFTFNMLKCSISSSWNFMSLYVWSSILHNYRNMLKIWFWHKKLLGSVRKRSHFGLPGSVVTNTSGKCSGFVKDIELFCTYTFWNVILNSDLWFSSCLT